MTASAFSCFLRGADDSDIHCTAHDPSFDYMSDEKNVFTSAGGCVNLSSITSVQRHTSIWGAYYWETQKQVP